MEKEQEQWSNLKNRLPEDLEQSDSYIQVWMKNFDGKQAIDVLMNVPKDMNHKQFLAFMELNPQYTWKCYRFLRTGENEPRYSSTITNPGL